MMGFTTLTRMVGFGIAAFALTALAAAQTPDVTYSWAAPAPVQQSQATQQAQSVELANSVTANNAFAPAATELQNDYRGIRGARGQDVLGTINDVVYGKPHTARTIAIIGGTAAGGAILGGVTYGKTGAVIGAVGGGIAGWAIDRATRHRTIFGY